MEQKNENGPRFLFIEKDLILVKGFEEEEVKERRRFLVMITVVVTLNIVHC